MEHATHAHAQEHARGGRYHPVKGYRAVEHAAEDDREGAETKGQTKADKKEAKRERKQRLMPHGQAPEDKKEVSADPKHAKSQQEQAFEDQWHVKGTLPGAGEKQFRQVTPPHGKTSQKKGKRQQPESEGSKTPIQPSLNPKEAEKEAEKKADTEAKLGMSYDEYRLWKHSQKSSKKKSEMLGKYGDSPAMKSRAEQVEQEPEFKTYAEYRDWK